MSTFSRRLALAWSGLSLLLLCTCSRAPEFSQVQLDTLSALVAGVDQDRLMGRVTELTTAHREDLPLDCSGWLGTGLPLPEYICHLTRDKSRALVQRRFEALGLKVRHQEVTAERYTLSNVIAELPGTSRPEEIVLVAAHYDAFHEGADDNTSGVAAMLELAEVLSAHRFERTVRFVGFDLEELWMVGSNHYAQALPSEERVVATVVFDAIGYYDTRPGSQLTIPGVPSPSEGDFLAVIHNEPSNALATDVYALSRALGLAKVVTLGSAADGLAPGLEPLLRSDHNAFWLRGRPALFFTDTASFRNPHYHQPTDTVDTLHPELYRKTVQLSAAALALWAGGPL